MCVCMQRCVDRNFPRETTGSWPLCVVDPSARHFYSTLADYGKREPVQRFPSTGVDAPMETMEGEREREPVHWKIK